jgi:hypothetical protein
VDVQPPGLESGETIRDRRRLLLKKHLLPMAELFSGNSTSAGNQLEMSQSFPSPLSRLNRRVYGEPSMRLVGKLVLGSAT